MSRHPREFVRVAGRRIPSKQIEFFRSALLEWWGPRRRMFPWRRSSASVYHQIVSEVLLQRTRAETVAAFWPLFIATYPNWAALANSTEKHIEATLRPIGLSQQRAPRLRDLARFMVSRRGRFPESRVEIEALPAVGQYVANAILLFCFGKREPFLDVNMARVLERFFGPRTLADIRYDPYLQGLSRLVINGTDCRSINWAILDLAAAVCRAQQPCIERCPLKTECRFARGGRTGAHVSRKPNLRK
jgi:A/G-specific adenine glycosylase